MANSAESHWLESKASLVIFPWFELAFFDFACFNRPENDKFRSYLEIKLTMELMDVESDDVDDDTRDKAQNGDAYVNQIVGHSLSRVENLYES